MTEETTEPVKDEVFDNNIIGKMDLIELVAAKGNFTKSESTRAVECMITTIQDSIKNGVEVQIRKFGTFTPAIQKAFTARNPRNGDPVEVAEKKTLRFKASKLFKNYINDENLDDEDETEDEVVDIVENVEL